MFQLLQMTTIIRILWESFRFSQTLSRSLFFVNFLSPIAIVYSFKRWAILSALGKQKYSPFFFLVKSLNIQTSYTSVFQRINTLKHLKYLCDDLCRVTSMTFSQHFNLVIIKDCRPLGTCYVIFYLKNPPSGPSEPFTNSTVKYGTISINSPQMFVQHFSSVPSRNKTS